MTIQTFLFCRTEMTLCDVFTETTLAMTKQTENLHNAIQ
jgi:hypothetical protein